MKQSLSLHGYFRIYTPTALLLLSFLGNMIQMKQIEQYATV